MGFIAVDNISRRKFGKAIRDAATISLATSSTGAATQYQNELKEIEKLRKDLENAGYTVHQTSKAQEFQRLTSERRRDAPKDGKTIIVIYAHGGKKDGQSYIQGDEYSIPMNEISQAMPGHLVIISQACGFNPNQINNSNQKRITVFGLTDQKLATGSIPLFRAFREGIRTQNAVEGTRQAMDRLLKKSPLLAKLAAKLIGSELTIAGHPEFKL